MATAQQKKKAKDAKGLRVGSLAPGFETMAADGSMFNLHEALKNGKVMIVFYRGYWCPVCNKHLASIQDSLEMIETLGVKVVAISPQKPEYLDTMAQKSGARFTLLYDRDYKIASTYDVLFNPSKIEALTYNVFLGAKLGKTQSDDSQRLPIPATYIIDSDGTIIWRQFDPNYHHRSKMKDVLDFLKSKKLKSEK